MLNLVLLGQESQFLACSRRHVLGVRLTEQEPQEQAEQEPAQLAPHEEQELCRECQ